MAARLPALLFCGLLISMAGAGVVAATDQGPSSASESTTPEVSEQFSEVQTQDNETNESTPHHGIRMKRERTAISRR